MSIKFHLISILLVLSFTTEVLSIVPGIYVDNGEQIQLKYELDENELEELSITLADLLQVNPKVVEVSKEDMNMRKAALKFLMEIYKEFEESESADQPTENSAMDETLLKFKRQTDDTLSSSNEEKFLIKNSDVIMTFTNKRNLYVDKIEKSDDILMFDLSEIREDHVLMKAELRIFKGFNKGSENIDLQLVQISENGDSKTVFTKMIPVDYQGWLQIDLTDPVLDLLRNVTLRKELIFKLELGNSSKIQRDILIDSFLKKMKENPPFLVAYSKRSEIFKNFNQNRTRRSATSKNRYKRSNPFVSNWLESCHKEMVIVDFKNLGMGNIIIPETMQFEFCTGTCEFPISAHFNATNHAIMQELAHIKLPQLNIPKCRCSPRKYSDMRVISITEDGHDLLDWKNMIIRNCGCV